MPLDANRITTAAKATLVGQGMKPDDVLFGVTGKGALELIIDAIAQAVVIEFKTNGQVITTVSTIVVGSLPSGPGPALGSGGGSGIIQ